MSNIKVCCRRSVRFVRLNIVILPKTFRKLRGKKTKNLKIRNIVLKYVMWSGNWVNVLIRRNVHWSKFIVYLIKDKRIYILGLNEYSNIKQSIELETRLLNYSSLWLFFIFSIFLDFYVKYSGQVNQTRTNTYFLQIRTLTQVLHLISHRSGLLFLSFSLWSWRILL